MTISAQRGAGRPTRKSTSQRFTVSACSIWGKCPHSSTQRTVACAKPSATSAQCADGTTRSWRPWISRTGRSEEHTSELQSLAYIVCRLLLEKKKVTCYYYRKSGYRSL